MALFELDWWREGSGDSDDRASGRAYELCVAYWLKSVARVRRECGARVWPHPTTQQLSAIVRVHISRSAAVAHWLRRLVCIKISVRSLAAGALGSFHDDKRELDVAAAH